MMRTMILSCVAAIVFACGLIEYAYAQDTPGESACDTREARLLIADAKRATQWNWGWGTVYATSAVAHSGLAMWTDNPDLKVSLWTGAVKSTLGTFNQILFPNRVSAPGPGCHDLAAKLKQAREIERKRHNWFAHGTVVAANVAGFGIVAGITEDYLLAATGTVLGSLVGEFAIYTSPNRLRAAGLGLESVGLIPQVQRNFSGLSLQGTF